jgi:hypothetical protein
MEQILLGEFTAQPHIRVVFRVINSIILPTEGTIGKAPGPALTSRLFEYRTCADTGTMLNLVSGFCRAEFASHTEENII